MSLYYIICSYEGGVVQYVEEATKETVKKRDHKILLLITNLHLLYNTDFTFTLWSTLVQ